MKQSATACKERPWSSAIRFVKLAPGVPSPRTKESVDVILDGISELGGFIGGSFAEA
jgi:hypothetical protein